MMWDRAYRSVITFFVALFGIVSFFGLLSFLVDPQKPVRIAWFFLIVSLFSAVLCSLIDVVASANSSVKTRMPRTRRYVEAPGKGQPALLIVESNWMFGTGVGVSIYTQVQGIDRSIGIGFVESVKENGQIQVAVIEKEGAYEDVWSALSNNSPDSLANTFVRPGVQFRR